MFWGLFSGECVMFSGLASTLLAQAHFKDMNDKKKKKTIGETWGVWGKYLSLWFYDVWDTACRNNSLLSFIFLKACVFVIWLCEKIKDEIYQNELLRTTNAA